MYKKTHNDYNPSEKINRGYVGYFTQKVSHTTIDGHNSSITINFLLLFETGQQFEAKLRIIQHFRYKIPPYDENKRLGGKSKYDPRGIWVKCACDWYKKEPITHASKLQADFSMRTKPVLGKVLAP